MNLDLIIVYLFHLRIGLIDKLIIHPQFLLGSFVISYRSIFEKLISFNIFQLLFLHNLLFPITIILKFVPYGGVWF